MLRRCLAALAIAVASTAPLVVAGDSAAKGGITTLYSRDALSQTLCFADGRYGSVEQAGEVRNRCSDIDFGRYVPGSFSSGIEGGRIAAIADLGTEADLTSRYSVEQTVGGGQAFASIQLDQGRFTIGRNKRQPLSGVDVQLGKLRSVASVPIAIGHIYLLHIRDQHDPSVDRFIKFLVVAYTQGEYVTIRWQEL